MATAASHPRLPAAPALSLPPRRAEVMTVVGGLLVAGVGALLAVSYAGAPSVGSLFPSAWGIFLGLCGVATGIGILLCVAAIHRRPSHHLVGGAFILLLSVVSLIVASGGLLVGFVLTVVGGLWLFIWSPPANATARGPPTVDAVAAGSERR